MGVLVMVLVLVLVLVCQTSAFIILRQVIHSSVPLIAVYFLTLIGESQKIASDLLLHISGSVPL
jgi:hypothetical protein